MKIKNVPAAAGLATRFKDRLVIRYDPRFGPVVQSWPKRGRRGVPRGDPAKVALWDMAITFVKTPEPSEYADALQATKGTAFYARDILISAIYGNHVSWPGWGWRIELAKNIQAQLDSITNEAGSILYRAEDGWHGLARGDDAQVLTWLDSLSRPTWQESAAAGITELTGDAAAGPGSGSQEITFASTGVAPGNYTLADITVDAKGRITAAADGSPPSAAGGLWSGLMSPLPTQISTGFTTWLNQPSGATVSNIASGLAVHDQSANSVYALLQQAAPATPYQRTALLMMSGSFSINASGLLGWSDGVKAQVFFVQPNQVRVGMVTNSNITGGAQTAAPALATPRIIPVWVRLSDSGTVVLVEVSYDGAWFFTLQSITKSTGFLGASGYTNLVFGMDNESVTGLDNATILMSWQ